MAEQKPETKPIKSSALPRSLGTSQPQLPVHLEFYSPAALEVFVAGSFNDWAPRATPLRKRGKGEWSADLSLKPGSYEYRFVVDGKWVEDPKAPAFALNPFGGRNSVLKTEVSA